MALEFLKNEGIFSELREIFEEVGKTKIVTPISGKEYVIDEIRAAELNALKKSRTIQQIIRKILELVVLKVDAPQDKVLQENSYLDYPELILGNLRATYRKGKLDKLECEECGANLEKMEYNYNDVKNTSKTWDKDVPFDRYEFSKEIEIDHPKEKDKKVKMKFYFRIPNLSEFYSYTVKMSKDVNINPNPSGNEVPVNLSILNPSDTIKMMVKKVEVQIGEDKHDVLEDKYVIEEIIDKIIPLGIIDELIDGINEELRDYVPIYKFSVKCPECGAENTLIFNPLIEFIERIFNAKTNR